MGPRFEPHAGRLLLVLLAGQFMANVDTSIVNVSTPAIHDGLGASGSELQLIVSGYILAYAMLLITGARLGDTRGYRRMFLTGLVTFTAASLACGLAPDPFTLIVARVVQGAGSALMVPQALSGIQLSFSGPARARALGLYAVALSSSAVVGQILGGVLISADLLGTGWRPVFLINVPIGVALIVAAVRWLPADRPSHRRRLDLAGVAMLSGATLLAVLPLVLGREAGWPAWTWVCLVASVPVLAIFLAWERGVTRRGGYPLLNLHVLRSPAVSWG
jgi:MFS family permease